MANQLDIQLNLEAEVQIFQNSFGIDVNYPNTKYIPVEGVDYIKISYINGDVFQRQISEDSPNRSFIIMQLDIFVSPNEGKIRAKEIIDALEVYFKRGLTINNNTLRTRITNFVAYTNKEDTVNFNPFVQITTRTDYPN